MTHKSQVGSQWACDIAVGPPLHLNTRMAQDLITIQQWIFVVTSIFYTVFEENRAGIHDNRYDIKSDTAVRKSWIGERLQWCFCCRWDFCGSTKRYLHIWCYTRKNNFPYVFHLRSGDCKAIINSFILFSSNHSVTSCTLLVYIHWQFHWVHLFICLLI